jgi:hypothetical protein
MSDTPADEQRGEQPGGGSRAAPAAWLEKHRFQAGQSGNPGGRPKGRVDLTRRLERALLEAVSEDETYADLLARSIAKAVITDPIKGTRLILSILDRDEGPVEKGPLVEFNVGSLAPEPPPLAGSPDGSGPPPLRDHLRRLVAIATERGLADVASIVDASVIDGEVVPRQAPE